MGVKSLSSNRTNKDFFFSSRTKDTWKTSSSPCTPKKQKRVKFQTWAARPFVLYHRPPPSRPDDIFTAALSWSVMRGSQSCVSIFEHGPLFFFFWDLFFPLFAEMASSSATSQPHHPPTSSSLLLVHCSCCNCQLALRLELPIMSPGTSIWTRFELPKKKDNVRTDPIFRAGIFCRDSLSTARAAQELGREMHDLPCLGRCPHGVSMLFCCGWANGGRRRPPAPSSFSFPPASSPLVHLPLLPPGLIKKRQQLSCDAGKDSCARRALVLSHNGSGSFFLCRLALGEHM